MSDINTILDAVAESGVDLRKDFLGSLKYKPSENSEAVESALEEMFGTSEGSYPTHKVMTNDARDDI